MNMPVIETVNLRKKYKNNIAVNNLSLSVGRGEIFGLVGADGAGKTTTIQILCTLSLPTSGEARILGMDTVKESGNIKPRIGYMSERFSLYPTLTVEQNLDFFARMRGIPRQLSEQRKNELLSFCRLEHFRERQAEHLSGGMQKKLALACSLIHEPEVLFLDEPTTGVDPVSRRDFWSIISGFLNRGITVFASTPYLDEAERFNRVALMHRGKIIAIDSPKNLAAMAGEILEVRARPMNKAIAILKQALVDPQVFGDTVHIAVDRAQDTDKKISRLLEQSGVEIESIRYIPAGLEDAFVNRLGQLEEKAPGHAEPVADAVLNTQSNGKEATVKVASLSRKFGDFTAVDNVTFEVKRGEIFGLLGPNGSGKTTTIRMLTGLLAPSSGSSFVLGRDMARDITAARSKMGYMSQKFSLYSDLTVDENINFYGGLYGLTSSQLGQGKAWVLDMAGLRGKENIVPRELSGGWKQRLALGCTIIHSPEVVFLDEPTAGVDPLSRRAFWELIQDLAARGTTIFITTHYMDEAEHCNRLGLMYQGKLIALGSPSQLKSEQTKGALLEIITPDYSRVLETLSGDERFKQASLFGNAIHIIVENAETAAQDIRKLLAAGNISFQGVNRIPFTMEDVFISMVEEQAGRNGKGT